MNDPQTDRLLAGIFPTRTEATLRRVSMRLFDLAGVGVDDPPDAAYGAWTPVTYVAGWFGDLSTWLSNRRAARGKARKGMKRHG